MIKALQQYVRSEAAVSNEGPAILKELFSLRVPPQVGQRARWKLRQVRAIPRDGWWDVSGEVAVDDPQSPYAVLPKLSFDAESGRGLPIDWLELSSQDATADGGRLLADAGTQKVRFRGRTAAVTDVDTDRCLLRIDATVIMEAQG